MNSKTANKTTVQLCEMLHIELSHAEELKQTYFSQYLKTRFFPGNYYKEDLDLFKEFLQVWWERTWAVMEQKALSDLTEQKAATLVKRNEQFEYYHTEVHSFRIYSLLYPPRNYTEPLMNFIKEIQTVTK